jgi:hypothetical protein
MRGLTWACCEFADPSKSPCHTASVASVDSLMFGTHPGQALTARPDSWAGESDRPT